MPKVIINRGRNAAERQSIVTRTTEINKDLHGLYGGEFVRLGEIAAYLRCSTRSVRRYLYDNYPPVPHACGTKAHRTIDVARRLAELEARQ